MREWLDRLLPPDAAERCNDRLAIAVMMLPSIRNRSVCLCVHVIEKPVFRQRRFPVRNRAIGWTRGLLSTLCCARCMLQRTSAVRSVEAGWLALQSVSERGLSAISAVLPSPAILTIPLCSIVQLAAEECG